MIELSALAGMILSVQSVVVLTGWCTEENKYAAK